MPVTDLPGEVLAAATALGVVSNGSLSADFFQHPLDHLRRIVTDSQQRSALLTALDALLPPPDDLAGGSDATSKTTRHPIVRTSHGALALAITRSGSASDPTVVVGLWGTATHEVSGCSIELDIPLVRGDDSGAAVVVGSAQSPIAMGVDVPVGLTRPADPIGLTAARISALLITTPDVTDSRVLVKLTGLDLGTGPNDLVLDPLDLPGDVSHVLSSLLLAGLAQADPGDAALAQLIAHLPAVLGLDGSLPVLPIGALVSDAGAFRTWIGSLLTATVSGRPALVAWLDALGQLLGAPALAPALTTLPGPADPVRIPVVDGGANGFTVTVEAYLDTPTGSATAELHVSVSAGIGGDLASVHADAELLVIPLGGNTPTRTLTAVQLVAESAGPLWPRGGSTDTELQVGRARGGLRYDGTTVRPILELDNVHVELPDIVATPTTFDRLDLTQATTLASAASDTVLSFLTSQLGTGIGASVLGLIGLTGTPTAEYIGAFTNDPLRAIGALHRRLLDSHQYAPMAEQIAALFGVPATFTNTQGTAADPWLVPFAELPVVAGATLRLQLAIWDVPSGTDHEVHLALRLATPPAGPSPSWSLGLSVDLLTFALPHSGAVRTGLLGGVDVTASVALPEPTGALVTADSLDLSGHWSPGTPFQVTAAISGVEVAVDGAPQQVGSISLPDGLTAAAMLNAWPAVRALLARAASGWGGSIGAAVAALLGLGTDIGGLPSAWPALQLPPGGVMDLLDDPLGLLRSRLADLVSAEVGADGMVAFHAALDLVLGALGGRLPAAPSAALPPLPTGPQVAGSGTYDDPWAIPLTDPTTPLVAEPVELITWLEPGPPPSWATVIAGSLQAGEPDLTAALGGLGGWVGSVRDAMAGLAPRDLTAWLSAAAAAVDGTDGIVSSDQSDVLPAGVTAADPVSAAHHLVPQAAAAVTATLAHLQANAANLPVILVAPSFAPDDVWAPLLAAAEATPVRVDLRVPGVDPGVVDLTGVGAGTHYLVDLADDGTPTLDVLTARLDRVVQRVLTATGSAAVTLVGHSIGGIAVVAYAGANPKLCQAVVTLATPYAPLDPAQSFAGDVASGLRLVRSLVPDGLTSAPVLDAALRHLATALDGYSMGTPAQYPTAAFARTLPAVDLSQVPTLAVPAGLDSSVGQALAAALNTASGAAAPPAGAPTHLSWGLRTRIDAGTASGPDVDLYARFDAGRVRLDTAATDPAHPKQRVSVGALVTDPSGWLVGSAGTGAPLDVRLRAARLTLAHTPGGGTDFDVTFYDGSVRGAGLPALGLADAQAPELLHGVLSALAQTAASGTQAQVLLQLLQAIGLASYDDVQHTAAVYSDSLTAITTDPAAWFASRLPGAFEGIAGTLGLVEDAAVSGQPRTWHRTLGALPFELVVSSEPWTAGVRTTAPGLEFGAGASATASVLFGLSGQASIDAGITAAGVTLEYASAGGTLTLSAPPLVTGAVILPPLAAGQLAGTLLGPLSLTGLSAAITAALRDAVGGTLPVGPVTQLLTEAAQWLSSARHLGDGSGTFTPTAVAQLLGTVGTALGLATAADGSLQVAEGLGISATAGTGGALTLTLNATGLAPAGPGGPTIALNVGVQVEGAAHQVTPFGTTDLSLDLGSGWGTFGVSVNESASGFGLSIKYGPSTLELLPTFGGLWALISTGVEALLPGVLDALVQRLSVPVQPPILTAVLAVADSLNLRQPGGMFDSAALAALVASVTAGTFAPTPDLLASVVSAVLPAGAPVAVTGSSPQAPHQLAIDVTTLPAGLSGSVHLSANLPAGGSAPDLGLHLQSLGLGPVIADVQVAENLGRLGITASVTVDVSDAVGFDFGPAISLTDAAGNVAVTLQPLGAGSPLSIDLAPVPAIHPDRSQLGSLVAAWAVPVLARIALDATSGLLQTSLWAGGPTALNLLQAASLVEQTAHGLRPAHPLPAPAQMPHDIIGGLLGALGSVAVPVTSTMTLGLYTEGSTWLGLGVTGTIDIPAGDLTLSVLLGSPEITQWADPKPGLGVLLFDDSAALALRPAVRLGGVGLRLGKNSGALVDTDEIRVEAIRALVQAGLDLSGPQVGLVTPATGHTPLRAGLELEQVGMPLGAGSQPSNPIAGSLLQPSGQSGDDQPADPPSDLFLLQDDAGTLTVLINGKDGSAPLYVDIHKVFGPLHIDRIGLAHTAVPLGDAIGALIDGGVSIAGLTVDVQGLELDIPLKAPADMSQWRVDLAGLAASFISGPVSIVGGLLKTTTAGAIEYRGELAVDVGTFGLTALGAYARASDPSGGSYTSLFVYVLVNAPIGGPPYLFITGLSGGAGYNRQLVVPSDPSTMASFPLLQVMGSEPTDPMSTLTAMSAAMPPRRGSYWVAAGVTFTTFELLHTKAMAYVALDRGFEVGLIGLMTMALPAPTEALVSVELALSARYSSADELLAIRAQLTNNSWLISRDCQLTGGFAFYAWFGDSPQVLLTIGGFGPNWQITPGDPHASQYPLVPPVGFHWAVGGGVVVKGESYFALTPHQLAFGGRLEATYSAGVIKVWFMVWLDVELDWDPLHYHFDAGVSIGASFTLTIDLFFGSITISFTVSLGASVVVDGPPLHGSVTVELEIASVTVQFGELHPPGYLSWNDFGAKYAGIAPLPDASRGVGTSLATVAYGQLADSTQQATSAATAPTPDGSLAAPWQVMPEFGLSVISKTPLHDTSFDGQTVDSEGYTGVFDLAPTGAPGQGFQSSMTVTIELWNAQTSTGTAELGIGAGMAGLDGHFPISVWVPNPPPDTSKVSSSPTMTKAMSGASLAFPVTITPVVAPPDIPISTLVEDEPGSVRSLPFAVSAVLPSVQAPPSPVQPAPAAASPLLHAVLHPALVAAVRGHRHGTAAHARLGGLEEAALAGSGGGAALRPGETHVWKRGAAESLRATGPGYLRVTSLSPIGRVVDDQLAPAGDTSFAIHPEAASVAVAAAAAPNGPWGWSRATRLHQVGKATALGPGCALLLPRPAPPAVPHAVERSVPASRLLSGIHGVQTLLPPAASTAIVVLDRHAGVASDDLVVPAAQLALAHRISSGSRLVLVYRVVTVGEPVTVMVASARAWQISAVYGAPGPVPGWIERLTADPYLDVLATTTAGTAGAVQYQFAMSEGASP